MKAKSKKTLPKPRSRTKKPVPTPESTDPKDVAAEQRFARDLATRGEAVELDKTGKLPTQATHVITKTNPDGTVEVKRARFKFA
jgi:hypothetical protein